MSTVVTRRRGIDEETPSLFLTSSLTISGDVARACTCLWRVTILVLFIFAQRCVNIVSLLVVFMFVLVKVYLEPMNIICRMCRYRSRIHT